MKNKEPKKVLVEGPIPPDKIAILIANHQSKTNIGAHSIFLGQVRADEIDGKRVTAIAYSAYVEMAEKVFHEIREAAFSRFDMTCCHIYHSLGTVKAGELCLFVFTSSAHRKVAIEACNYLVEEIKLKVPVFGKELFDDQTHQWKVNQ
jgi:molybdopterin synthase catalytic subunit